MKKLEKKYGWIPARSTKVMKDRKKEANRKACRGKIK